MSAVEPLLPGEREATDVPDDIRRWLDVYRGLVARCRSHGIHQRRFEARLAYWERLAAGERPATDLEVHGGNDRAPDGHPRCPFAPFGLDSDLMAACPGFEGDDVQLSQVLPGNPVQGTSCLHLLVLESSRGFAAACGHPDGRPVHAGEEAARALGWTANRESLEMPGR